jgi:predicted small integral membrane protein
MESRKEAQMETRPADEQARPRGIALLTAVCLFAVGGVNLLLGEWLTTAFYLVGGFAFLKGREIERWPKAARYLFTIALAALAVAMFVKLIFQLKARG